MESRKAHERDFHDGLRFDAFGQRWSQDLEKTIQENPLWANMKYYAVEASKLQTIREWFQQYCPGKVVLDYCCGNGEDGFQIAQMGAQQVIGIDISDVSIMNCRQRAEEMGLKNISFQVMDAESLTLDDNSVDVITEYGALHHLDLAKAYGEMSRVLRGAQGRALCVEALGHNPIIHMYRKLTPHLRTAWEVDHILKKNNIEAARQFFWSVRIIGFFHLASLAAVPFRNTSVFDSLLAALEKIDAVLLKMPGVRWWAWCVVFELSEPRK